MSRAPYVFACLALAACAPQLDVPAAPSRVAPPVAAPVAPQHEMIQMDPATRATWTTLHAAQLEGDPQRIAALRAEAALRQRLAQQSPAVNVATPASLGGAP